MYIYQKEDRQVEEFEKVEETVQIEEAPCDESVPEVTGTSEDQPDYGQEMTAETIKSPPPDTVRSPSEAPSLSSASSDYSDLESYEARRAARRQKREMKMKEKVHSENTYS